MAGWYTDHMNSMKNFIESCTSSLLEAFCLSKFRNLLPFLFSNTQSKSKAWTWALMMLLSL